MKERPIIYSAPMIRAIRADLKTQTRRIIKRQPSAEAKDAGVIHSGGPTDGLWAWLDDPDLMWAGFTKDEAFRCPYGVPGDALWCKETWQYAPLSHCYCPQPSEASPCDDWSEGTGCRSMRADFVYRADEGARAPRWRPSIFMPRHISRLTLLVTDIRVQRLQAITDEDAVAEGVRRVGYRWEVPGICTTPVSAVDAFRCLWEYINGPGSWEANPWVFAITFERVNEQRAAA